ncbi:hypothetical protein OHV05_34850 [Kitasatospora sp. NBC_00070]|uniref:hypothetical protein n=1 Tax=Kitasatospora sp. NBC_00070 TaxID=2975962 RepID=UPI00324FF1D2
MDEYGSDGKATGRLTDARHLALVVSLIPAGIALTVGTGGVFRALGVVSLLVGIAILGLWLTGRNRRR